MSAPITVSGLMREGEGGLKESLSAFRKHHAEVATALLNVSGIGTIDGLPKDKDEPRPAYQHQPWPRMLYHPEGKEAIAMDDGEVEDLRRHGYRDEPYVKPRVIVLDAKAEKAELLRKNSELQGQITTQADLLNRMAARLEALEGRTPTEKKK